MESCNSPTIKANRLTLVLIYAVLEWTLIFFLLLNSLFFYLIIKFARYFRLKPPCLVCSSLDHILYPQNSCRNLICEHHSIELSKSRYCSTHRKLVESQELCVDCSFFHPDLAFQVKQLKCSCCGSEIEILPARVANEPCLGVLGDTQKGNLVSRDGYVGDLKREEGNSDQDEGKGNLHLEGSNSNGGAIRGPYENEIVLPQHLEFYIDHDDYGLIPVEFFNSDQERGGQVWRETDDELVFEPDGIAGEQNLSSYCLDVMKLDEPKIQDLPNKQEVDGIVKLDETEIESLPTIKSLEVEIRGEVYADVAADVSKVEKFHTKGQAEETNREVNLEVADVGLTTNDGQPSEVKEVDEVEAKIPTRDSEDVCGNESDEVGIKNGDVHVEEGPSTTSVIREASTDTSVLLESCGCVGSEAKTEAEGENGEENELNVVVEDGIPDTPTSMDSLQVLHRKLLLLGRSKMANDGSLDGSVVNDLEYGDGEGTMEELKSELRAERKTLRALYEELEEERNAAAIAASHTMAMINRLQEEKAMIEMEALQYQRMMEEQAEYDQEALQLMNEILVKREREKEELERELEASRKKLMNYEEREEISQGKYTTSSAFSSNKEESDGLSIELNNESKENGHHDSSADAILSLKDSLSSFEEERLSILEQLKVLEENLCTLAEEEDHQIRNMKTFEQFYQDNAEELSTTLKLNGDANGEHHQERAINGSKPKQLLPQLDEAAIVSDNEFSEEDEGRLDPFLLEELPLTKYESEKRRFTIEEEVERLYERLQALEADREFIKHCFGTLRKGDRGIYLLQEILQLLRDLKNVELRARSFDGVC